MRAALLQLRSGDDPAVNLAVTEALLREAASGGATFVATPECTNMVSFSRELQAERLRIEVEDPTLMRLSAVAAELGIWLLIGSLCLRGGPEPEARFVNRSLLVGPEGRVHARYDKIHMFDVELPGGESYRLLSERVEDWLAGIRRPTMAVSHGGVGRVLRRYLLDLDPQAAVTMPFPQDQAMLILNGTDSWI